jgi:serine/threonine-protein phosphatase PGAM5
MAGEKPKDLAACSAQLERLAATLFAPSTRGDRHELVVCHGNVTRWLVTKALDVDVDSWLVMSIGHASVTVLRVDAEGGVRVLSVGDVGHLPANLQSGRLDDPERSLAPPREPIARVP